MAACGRGFFSSRNAHKLIPERKATVEGPYETLALATVEKAVRDWIELKLLYSDIRRPEWLHKKKYPKIENAIAEIEEFLLGEEIKMYTDLNGKEILDKLYTMYNSGELTVPTGEFRRVG